LAVLNTPRNRAVVDAIEAIVRAQMKNPLFNVAEAVELATELDTILALKARRTDVSTVALAVLLLRAIDAPYPFDLSRFKRD
jgi:hypothetical protein